MVEVGSIEIIGGLDDGDIQDGFNRIIINFKEVENQSNQANAGFKRLSRETQFLSKALIGAGVAGVGTLTALATKSPALAGSLATIEVNALKLGNVFGSQIKPLFDEIGGNLIPSITQAISDNEGAISSLVDRGVQGLSDFSNLITGNIEEIDNLGSKLALIGGGTALGGLVGGKPGAAVGGLLGAFLGEAIPVPTDEAKAKFGAFAETATYFNTVNERLASGEGSFSGKVGLASLTFVQAVIDTLQWIGSIGTQKEMSIATADGIPR